eukprot:2145554-Rhodomonas_salina.1
MTEIRGLTASRCVSIAAANARTATTHGKHVNRKGGRRAHSAELGEDSVQELPHARRTHSLPQIPDVERVSGRS